MIWTYVIIAAILLIAELVYFKIADKCNNWKLNEASCQRIISDYQHHDIFIWTPDMDDLPE